MSDKECWLSLILLVFFVGQHDLHPRLLGGFGFSRYPFH